MRLRLCERLLEMIKNKYLAFAVRLLVMFLGIALMGFSISGLFWANLGSDPTSVLVDGLHSALHISHGSASNIVNISLLVLLIIINRKKLGIATVASALTTGSFITLSQNYFYILLPSEPNILLRFPVCLASVILNSMSLGIYINADLGTSSFDGIILTMHESYGISVKFAMYIFYAIVFILGIILGGVCGIGTIMSLLLCGILFEMFLNFFAKIKVKLY